MARLYIDNDMARFTRKDITLVDMELYDGRKFENLEPRRLFPLSGLEKYITLLDEEGVERGIIRDMKTLPEKERTTIEECLDEYYLIPRVTKITDCKEKYGVLRIWAQTNCGDVVIEIRNILHGIKLIYGTRVQLRDVNDNRYEISNINELDSRSRRLIDSFL